MKKVMMEMMMMVVMMVMMLTMGRMVLLSNRLVMQLLLINFLCVNWWPGYDKMKYWFHNSNIIFYDDDDDDYDVNDVNDVDVKPVRLHHQLVIGAHTGARSYLFTVIDESFMYPNKIKSCF